MRTGSGRRPRSNDERWRHWLTTPGASLAVERGLLRRLPREPRCKLCNAPFAGVGGRLMRIMGRRPWPKNPNFCTICEANIRKHPGGAEVELSMLFADVRGSTTLAERCTPREFTALMNRFYRAASQVLIDANAIVDKMVGDEVIGLFPPYVGPRHARLAVESARRLLEATGHADPAGPWLPVGAGVHTGVAYLGIVGSADTVTDLTALGDAVNVTARLAALAGPGEVLVSEAAAAAAGLGEAAETRWLQLKGRTEPLGVHVLRAGF